MPDTDMEIPESLRREPVEKVKKAPQIDTTVDEPPMELPDGVEWMHIFWIRGPWPSRKHRNEVRDPPCAGWQQAFVLRGKKLSTIFCPYSFTSYSVSNDAGELTMARQIPAPRRGWVVPFMQKRWKQFQTWGWQRDYDACAAMLKRLGAEVPEQIMTGGEVDERRKGGKDAGGKLLKPVKRKSKRGKFLVWFLEADNNARSVREAMAEFSMTRSNALSYLFMLKKDHGLGYVLVGDIATVSLPEGCENPFDDAPPADDDGDDSWLD